MKSRVARSVGKVAEIPLQLKRDKESLSKLQNQLAKAKKSIEENSERKIQELSMQQSNAVRDLENQIRLQMKEVNMLQKSLLSTMTDGKGLACSKLFNV